MRFPRILIIVREPLRESNFSYNKHYFDLGIFKKIGDFLSRICSNFFRSALFLEKLLLHASLTLFRTGFFEASHGLGGGGGGAKSLTKICHTYPTMMKLGTVIPYLIKTKKIYKSRGTSLEFSWHLHFFTRNQQILLHQEIQVQVGF